MDLNGKHIVVLGAAGKMGSGIALLLLQRTAGLKEGFLTLLDVNPQSFTSLKTYLREHLSRYAEKNINYLRKLYRDHPELIDNEEMITAFVEGGLDRTRFATSLDECSGAQIIFEAIIEDIEVKADVLSKVNAVADPQAIYFSNTSSIPIHVLEERSGIHGRLIGFHFYNPPAVQKLLELIIPKGAKKEAVESALEMGKLLNKTIVFSQDIAGFIGNGHFIREASEACAQVEQLRKKMTVPEAICTVNTVTQDLLIRPMGIFQLIDYVGIDVVQHIMKIMSRYLSGQAFNSSLIDAMVSRGVRGGQKGDGSQKEGFFSYDRGKPVKVYDMENGRYVPYIVPEGLPQGHETWKAMSKDKDRNEKLTVYLASLPEGGTEASQLAMHFLKHSRSIAEKLVEDGVAGSLEDVDTVLKEGFFHLYGATK
jgi:3-hydroxyacyl-CoA dehydrogenase